MLKTKEQLAPCKVELNIEVEPETVTNAFETAFKQLAKYVAIPGFRKGKAPKQLLEKYLDEEELKERAAREMIPGAYEDALKESGVDAWDLPSVEVVQIEREQPFVFKAIVPLTPKVELGPYTKLKVDRMAVVVTDADVDTRLTEVLERGASLETVTGRPVQKDDVVQLEMQRHDGEDAQPFTQMVQAGANLESFDSGLIGMVEGEEKDIDLVYPEDHPDKELTGKTIKLKAKVLEIKERKLPELTDEYAKKAGFESMEELRKSMLERMQRAAEDVADRQMESQLIFQVIEKSQIDFPDEMKEQEAEERFKDLMGRLAEAKIELADYLREIGQTYEQLRAEIDTNSARDIKTNLALYEIAKRENITVTQEDIDAEVEQLAAERNVPKASMQAYVDRTEGSARVSSRLLRKKILDFLVQSSNIKNVATKGESV